MDIPFTAYGTCQQAWDWVPAIACSPPEPDSFSEFQREYQDRSPHDESDKHLMKLGYRAPHAALAVVHLQITGGSESDICDGTWSLEEQYECRRIVRFEKQRQLNTINIQASVVPLQHDDNDTGVLPNGNQYLDVSCLLCFSYAQHQEGSITEMIREYFVTSIDVVKIVEFILEIDNVAWNTRIERGRIRSILRPFWSTAINANKGTSSVALAPNDRLKGEMAMRVMNYQYRKPYRNNRQMSVMRWCNLILAMKKVFAKYSLNCLQD